jgi:hypothetical protein
MPAGPFLHSVPGFATPLFLRCLSLPSTGFFNKLESLFLVSGVERDLGEESDSALSWIAQETDVL